MLTIGDITMLKLSQTELDAIQAEILMDGILVCLNQQRRLKNDLVKDNSKMKATLQLLNVIYDKWTNDFSNNGL